MWLILTGVVLGGGLVFWLNRRPKTFSYRGKKYTRHADGSYTSSDGGYVSSEERRELDKHWDSTHDSSSSDSSDGGSSDGGGGDGGGGGD